jgi:hypothetical protein
MAVPISVGGLGRVDSADAPRRSVSQLRQVSGRMSSRRCSCQIFVSQVPAVVWVRRLEWCGVGWKDSRSVPCELQGKKHARFSEKEACDRRNVAFARLRLNSFVVPFMANTTDSKQCIESNIKRSATQTITCRHQRTAHMKFL